MGVSTSFPCCTERLREGGQVRFSKLKNALVKMGSKDEFTDMAKELNSTELLIEPVKDFKHIWAVPPKSRAAKAALVLSMRLANNTQDISLGDKFMKAGCLTPIVNFLIDGKALDKVHAGVLALLSFTDKTGSEDVIDELVQLDVISLLCKYMGNTKYCDGLRHSCAAIVHSLIRQRSETRQEFINCGGLIAIQSLIIDASGTDEVGRMWLVDRIQDCRELLVDKQGQIDPVLMVKMKEAGIPAELEKLSKSENLKVAEYAAKILELIY